MSFGALGQVPAADHFFKLPVGQELMSVTLLGDCYPPSDLLPTLGLGKRTAHSVAFGLESLGCVESAEWVCVLSWAWVSLLRGSSR